MKAKLIKIREALEYTLETTPNFHIQHKTEAAVKTVDELLAMMDSPELVDGVSEVMAYTEYDDYGELYKDQMAPIAQAAINFIKGE